MLTMPPLHDDVMAASLLMLTAPPAPLPCLQHHSNAVLCCMTMLTMAALHVQLITGSRIVLMAPPAPLPRLHTSAAPSSSVSRLKHHTAGATVAAVPCLKIEA